MIMVVLCLQNNIESIHILIKSLLSRNTSKTIKMRNGFREAELTTDLNGNGPMMPGQDGDQRRTVSVMKLNFIPFHWLLVVKLPCRPAEPNGQICPSLTVFIAPFP